MTGYHEPLRVRAMKSAVRSKLFQSEEVWLAFLGSPVNNAHMQNQSRTEYLLSGLCPSLVCHLLNSCRKERRNLQQQLDALRREEIAGEPWVMYMAGS